MSTDIPKHTIYWWRYKSESTNFLQQKRIAEFAQSIYRQFKKYRHLYPELGDDGINYITRINSFCDRFFKPEQSTTLEAYLSKTSIETKSSKVSIRIPLHPSFLELPPNLALVVLGTYDYTHHTPIFYPEQVFTSFGDQQPADYESELNIQFSESTPKGIDLRLKEALNKLPDYGRLTRERLADWEDFLKFKEELIRDTALGIRYMSWEYIQDMNCLKFNLVARNRQELDQALEKFRERSLSAIVVKSSSHPFIFNLVEDDASRNWSSFHELGNIRTVQSKVQIWPLSPRSAYFREILAECEEYNLEITNKNSANEYFEADRLLEHAVELELYVDLADDIANRIYNASDDPEEDTRASGANLDAEGNPIDGAEDSDNRYYTDLDDADSEADLYAEDADDASDLDAGSYSTTANPNHRSTPKPKRSAKQRLLDKLAETIPSTGFLTVSILGELTQTKRHQRALKNLLQNEGCYSPYLASYLFNIEEARVPDFNPELLDLDWQNPNLNDKQKLAVKKMLAAPDICLIQGPPGTGKTTVIAEACYQFVKRGDNVLIASQSHDALDNALSRLPLDANIRALRLAKYEKRIAQEGRAFYEDAALGKYYRALRDHTREQHLKPAAELHQQIDKLQAKLEEFEEFGHRYYSLLEQLKDANAAFNKTTNDNLPLTKTQVHEKGEVLFPKSLGQDKLYTALEKMHEIAKDSMEMISQVEAALEFPVSGVTDYANLADQLSPDFYPKLNQAYKTYLRLYQQLKEKHPELQQVVDFGKAEIFTRWFMQGNSELQRLHLHKTNNAYYLGQQSFKPAHAVQLNTKAKGLGDTNDLNFYNLTLYKSSLRDEASLGISKFSLKELDNLILPPKFNVNVEQNPLPDEKLIEKFISGTTYSNANFIGDSKTTRPNIESNNVTLLQEIEKWGLSTVAHIPSSTLANYLKKSYYRGLYSRTGALNDFYNVEILGTEDFSDSAPGEHLDPGFQEWTYDLQPKNNHKQPIPTVIANNEFNKAVLTDPEIQAKFICRWDSFFTQAGINPAEVNINFPSISIGLYLTWGGLLAPYSKNPYIFYPCPPELANKNLQAPILSSEDLTFTQSSTERSTANVSLLSSIRYDYESEQYPWMSKAELELAQQHQSLNQPLIDQPHLPKYAFYPNKVANIFARISLWVPTSIDVEAIELPLYGFGDGKNTINKFSGIRAIDQSLYNIHLQTDPKRVNEYFEDEDIATISQFSLNKFPHSPDYLQKDQFDFYNQNADKAHGHLYYRMPIHYSSDMLSVVLDYVHATSEIVGHSDRIAQDHDAINQFFIGTKYVNPKPEGTYLYNLLGFKPTQLTQVSKFAHTLNVGNLNNCWERICYRFNRWLFEVVNFPKLIIAYHQWLARNYNHNLLQQVLSDNADLSAYLPDSAKQYTSYPDSHGVEQILADLPKTEDSQIVYVDNRAFYQGYELNESLQQIKGGIPLLDLFASESYANPEYSALEQQIQDQEQLLDEISDQRSQARKENNRELLSQLREQMDQIEDEIHSLNQQLEQTPPTIGEEHNPELMFPDVVQLDKIEYLHRPFPELELIFNPDKSKYHKEGNPTPEMVYEQWIKDTFTRFYPNPLTDYELESTNSALNDWHEDLTFNRVNWKQASEGILSFLENARVGFEMDMQVIKDPANQFLYQLWTEISQDAWKYKLRSNILDTWIYDKPTPSELADMGGEEAFAHSDALEIDHIPTLEEGVVAYENYIAEVKRNVSEAEFEFNETQMGYIEAILNYLEENRLQRQELIKREKLKQEFAGLQRQMAEVFTQNQELISELKPEWKLPEFEWSHEYSQMLDKYENSNSKLIWYQNLLKSAKNKKGKGKGKGNSQKSLLKFGQGVAGVGMINTNPAIAGEKLSAKISGKSSSTMTEEEKEQEKINRCYEYMISTLIDHKWIGLLQYAPERLQEILFAHLRSAEGRALIYLYDVNWAKILFTNGKDLGGCVINSEYQQQAVKNLVMINTGDSSKLSFEEIKSDIPLAMTKAQVQQNVQLKYKLGFDDFTAQIQYLESNYPQAAEYQHLELNAQDQTEFTLPELASDVQELLSNFKVSKEALLELATAFDLAERVYRQYDLYSANWTQEIESLVAGFNQSEATRKASPSLISVEPYHYRKAFVDLMMADIEDKNPDNLNEYFAGAMSNWSRTQVAEVLISITENPISKAVMATGHKWQSYFQRKLLDYPELAINADRNFIKEMNLNVIQSGLLDLEQFYNLFKVEVMPAESIGDGFVLANLSEFGHGENYLPTHTTQENLTQVQPGKTNTVQPHLTENGTSQASTSQHQTEAVLQDPDDQTEQFNNLFNNNIKKFYQFAYSTVEPRVIQLAEDNTFDDFGYNTNILLAYMFFGGRKDSKSIFKFFNQLLKLKNLATEDSVGHKLPEVYKADKYQINETYLFHLDTLIQSCGTKLADLRYRLQDLEHQGGSKLRFLEDWNRLLSQPERKAKSDWGKIGNDFTSYCNVIAVSCNEDPMTITNAGFDGFDVVIIDEVSKATPVELLAPLMRARKAILVGDHCQLPPVFDDKDIISLRERLVEEEASRRQRQQQGKDFNPDTYVSLHTELNAPINDDLKILGELMGMQHSDAPSYSSETVTDDQGETSLSSQAQVSEQSTGAETKPDSSSNLSSGSLQLSTIAATKAGSTAGSVTGSVTGSTTGIVSGLASNVIGSSMSGWTTSDIDRFDKMVTSSLFKEHFDMAPDQIKETLNVQYRMHPAIMEVINNFYAGELVCGNPDKDRNHHFELKKTDPYKFAGAQTLLSPEQHVLWVDTTDDAEGKRYRKSARGNLNELEAELIAKTLVEMDRQLKEQGIHGPGNKLQVGVVAFYLPQRDLIKEKIRQVTGGRYPWFDTLDVDVNTVIRYQGKEKPVILLSLVKNNGKDANKQWFSHSNKNKAQASQDEHREAYIGRFEFINVAMSRAQNLLIVFGAKNMLEERAVALPVKINPDELNPGLSKEAAKTLKQMRSGTARSGFNLASTNGKTRIQSMSELERQRQAEEKSRFYEDILVYQNIFDLLSTRKEKDTVMCSTKEYVKALNWNSEHEKPAHEDLVSEVVTSEVVTDYVATDYVATDYVVSEEVATYELATEEVTAQEVATDETAK